MSLGRLFLGLGSSAVPMGSATGQRGLFEATGRAAHWARRLGTAVVGLTLPAAQGAHPLKGVPLLGSAGDLGTVKHIVLRLTRGRPAFRCPGAGRLRVGCQTTGQNRAAFERRPASDSAETCGIVRFRHCWNASSGHRHLQRLASHTAETCGIQGSWRRGTGISAPQCRQRLASNTALSCALERLP